ncbi:MAG: 1-acyl-sn-glycerol-3-phosphate acyltransferase [Oscillospiraceae bacterium]|nr:1-acyl-sn-glycerol-3-phosphate acyltransferase [Oscillospiraceae bacterium]
MLLRGITLLSLVIAAAFCFGFDAFVGFAWLWMLPVSFAASWLALLVIAFLYLYIMCARVDKSVPQEEDSPFYRRLAAVYIEAIIKLVRVRVHTEGLEKTPKEGRFLLVCNHLFDADPGILLHYFKDSQLAFISKKENSDMLIVGDIMHKIQCQMIDRENDRQALKTILKCIQIIKEDKASIAVFPEGYCSRDNKLHHFRPGVFKIAQKTGVPIVVCTIRNTRAILPNFLRLKPTDVELHLVDVIPGEEVRGVPTVELSDRVHRLMAEDLGPDLVAEE